MGGSLVEHLPLVLSTEGFLTYPVPIPAPLLTLWREFGDTEHKERRF